MADGRHYKKPTGSLAERVKTIRDNLNDVGLSQEEITPMERGLAEAVHDILDALDEHAKANPPPSFSSSLTKPVGY